MFASWLKRAVNRPPRAAHRGLGPPGPQSR